MPAHLDYGGKYRNGNECLSLRELSVKKVEMGRKLTVHTALGPFRLLNLVPFVTYSQKL